MGESSSALTLLLKRLEGATSRLEELALTKSKDFKSQSASFSGTSSLKKDSRQGEAESDDPIYKEFVPAFESMVVPYVEKYLSLSEDVGDVVAEQSKIIKELMLKHQRRFIELASRTQKPNDKDVLTTMFQPSQAALEGLIKHVEANRASPLFNHLSTISSGIPAVSWVIVEPDTATCVKELVDSSQFYANRVTKAFKSGDPTHLDWASSVVEMFSKLYEYVVKYHQKGLLWNPRGVNPNENAENEGSSLSAKDSSAPLLKVDIPSTSSEGLLSELNKGSSIGSGKKIDKTTGSRLLGSGTDSGESMVPPAKSSARTASKIFKEGETILEGHKYLVQNYSNTSVLIEPTQSKQTVYISNCQFTTIEVKGKCSKVIMDNCKKSGVAIDTALGCVEVINCQSCQVQITQTTPIISIEKTDGVQLYLSKDSLGTQLFTTRSSQVSLQVPSSKPGEDGFFDRPIPEKFMTTIVQDQIVTVSVDQTHS